MKVHRCFVMGMVAFFLTGMLFFSVSCASAAIQQEKYYSFHGENRIPQVLDVNVSAGKPTGFWLEENGTTGYQWAVVQKSPDIEVSLKFQPPSFPKPGEAALCGAPGRLHVEIQRTQGRGEGSVILEYRRSWEPEKPAHRLELRIHP